jgi:hypothetical protein
MAGHFIRYTAAGASTRETKGVAQELRLESPGKNRSKFTFLWKPADYPAEHWPTVCSCGTGRIAGACQAARGPLTSKFVGCIVHSQHFHSSLVPTGKQRAELFHDPVVNNSTVHSRTVTMGPRAGFG